MASLDELNTCVNPPVIQGWAWCLAIVGAAVMLSGAGDLHANGPGDGLGILKFLGPLPLWPLAVVIGGFFSHDVELRDGAVSVRRWTDVWFDRPGKLVGSRSSVHAVLSCGTHLHLEGDADSVSVSMGMWPNSSRQALEERFDHWGIELEFPGEHHPDHPQYWNHKHHRISHALPDRRGQ